MKIFVTVVILGFPIALIIAWAFELTPGGIKRTESADAAQERSRGGAWVALVVIAVTLSVGLFFVGRYTALNRSATPILASSNKSVVVFLFVSLSDASANVYVVTGIQHEVLTRLSNIV